MILYGERREESQRTMYATSYQIETWNKLIKFFIDYIYQLLKQIS